jgi:hypothetical protein
MKGKLLLVVFLFIGWMAGHSQSKLNPRQAVTLMGKMRINSARIANAKLLELGNYNAEKYKKDVDNFILTFNEGLNAYTNYKSNEYVVKRINILTASWAKYKEALAAIDTTKKKKDEMLKWYEIVYENCNDAALSLTEYAYDVNTENSDAYRAEEVISKHINMVTKSRINSIKMAINYQLAYSNLRNNATMEIAKHGQYIQVLLSEMSSASINTPVIDEAISNAYTEWNSIKEKFFVKNSFKLKDLTTSPLAMQDAMLAFQQKLDKITFAYVTLAE